jgi:hypothetical protein
VQQLRPNRTLKILLDSITLGFEKAHGFSHLDA